MEAALSPDFWARLRKKFGLANPAPVRNGSAIVMYRVWRSDDQRSHTWADRGDERLLGEFVGSLMRGGCEAVIVERVLMTRRQAQEIPQEDLLG